MFSERTMCFDCKHQLLTDQNKNFAPSIYFIIKKRRISIRIMYLQTVVLCCLLIYIPLFALRQRTIHHPPATLASIFRLYGCVHSPASYTLLSRHHKKSCMNEKKASKEKTERFLFRIWTRTELSSPTHGVPPFRRCVGRKLTVSFVFLLSAFFIVGERERWGARGQLGNVESMALGWFQPTLTHRAKIFFLFRFAHSSPPISIYLSETSHCECFPFFCVFRERREAEARYIPLDGSDAFVLLPR